jgi:hypothetical protein
MTSEPASPLSSLRDLRTLRSAPSLDALQNRRLRQELAQRMAACAWFTLGVMAPSAGAALAALRAAEASLGWKAHEPDPAGAADGEGGGDTEADGGPVFLKANQHTGRFLLRREQGLGEGILITGHQPADAAAEDTWGPLPLDFFAPAGPAEGGGPAAP